MDKDICERSFELAIRIVKLCRVLDKEPGVSRTLANQLLRSGTSVGANVEECQAAQSKADFISKLSIALKEARETRYWLRLLVATEIFPASKLENLQKEVEVVNRILGKILISTKQAKP